MKLSFKPSVKVLSLVDSMGWRELLEQACCPHFGEGQTPEREYGSAFFHPSSKASLKSRIDSYLKACEIRPLVTTDMESGPGNMIKDGTKFPSMMACGRCGDEELAWKMGKAAALEGREIGFNWSLAPCADLCAEPDNPIVSVRSAGSDPELIARIAGAYVKGMQDNGMAATAKHFPGDGFSLYDQHLTTTVNPLSKKEWRAKSGKVFKSLIKDGVMAVMPGHISLPAFDKPDPKLKLCPPATLSKALMEGLLRDDLGFEGLIVSDAINMGGIVNFMNYYDACAEFWERGGDCLLFPDMDARFYDEMERRLESGMLSLETLRKRVARVLSLKERLGLLGEAPPTAERPDLELHAKWSQEISERAVEVLRDREGILPVKLPPGAKVLHLVVANDLKGKKEVFDAFSALLREASYEVVEMADPGPDAARREVLDGGYSLIVCSIGSRPLYGVSSVRVHGPEARNMMGGWMRLGVPTVFVCHFHPFAHLEFEAAMDTAINTYGSTVHSLKKAMKLIFA